MGKNSRSKTKMLHVRIKREKMMKLEMKRLNEISARAEANLAKYNMSKMDTETVMQPLSVNTIKAAKIVIDSEVEGKPQDMMDLVENIGEIPDKTYATSIKNKRLGRGRTSR